MTDFFEAVAMPDVQKELLCRDLLAEFGVLNVRANANGEMIHCCVMPWHNETHPSASLNYQKLVYKCLGCKASGGLLWLIGMAKGLSGPEARSWLAEQTGLGGADYDLNALLSVFDALYDIGKHNERAPMPRFSDKMIEPWMFIHPILTTGAPDLGIQGRGIPEANLISMRVGYAPEYSMGKNEDGTPKPTSERIVIPHYWKGNLVGWQTRRVWDDGTPKYKSSADFPKDTTIYNYDPKRRKALVVESPMTVLRHLHHLPIEGTFGADVTERQVRLLAAHETVVLMMDPDPAGWKAVEGWVDETTKERHPGLIDRLSPYSNVEVVENPWAADGADMDDQTIDALYHSAVPWPLWSRPTRLMCIQCKTSHPGACP